MFESWSCSEANAVDEATCACCTTLVERGFYNLPGCLPAYSTARHTTLVCKLASALLRLLLLHACAHRVVVGSLCWTPTKSHMHASVAGGVSGVVGGVGVVVFGSATVRTPCQVACVVNSFPFICTHSGPALADITAFCRCALVYRYVGRGMLIEPMKAYTALQKDRELLIIARFRCACAQCRLSLHVFAVAVPHGRGNNLQLSICLHARSTSCAFVCVYVCLQHVSALVCASVSLHALITHHYLLEQGASH